MHLQQTIITILYGPSSTHRCHHGNLRQISLADKNLETLPDEQNKRSASTNVQYEMYIWFPFIQSKEQKDTSHAQSCQHSLSC